MKKYYCSNCQEFKSRIQLRMVDDGRLGHLTCKWCHKRTIQKTDDLIIKFTHCADKIEELSEKVESLEDLNTTYKNRIRAMEFQKLSEAYPNIRFCSQAKYDTMYIHKELNDNLIYYIIDPDIGQYIEEYLG